MDKPLLRLKRKDFLSGIGQGAFDQKHIFYKADGLNPLYDAGVGENARNGILIPGAAGVSISGLVDTPIGLARDFSTASLHFYVIGASGHFYDLLAQTPSVVNPTPGSDSFVDRRSATPITNPTGSIEVYKTRSGSTFVYYWQQGQIGRCTIAAATGSSSYPTGWTDNWMTTDVETDSLHPTHRYFDMVLYGNGAYVGKIYDDGTSTAAHTGHALDIPGDLRVGDISDDGTYAVIACNQNYVHFSLLAKTKILFWDGFSDSWIREWELPEGYIWALEKIPGGVLAFGTTGVWQVSLSGFKKILSRNPAAYQSGNPFPHPQMASSYGAAAIWAGENGANKVLKSIGKLDESMPSAYLHPFLLGSNNKTLVDGQAYRGYVLVGSDAPDMKAYPFGAGTPQTGVTAQTTYIPLNGRYQIDKIKIILARPMASGDNLTAAVYGDESASSTIAGVGASSLSFGGMSFTNDGAIRAKTLTPASSSGTLVLEDLSVALTWVAGAVQVEEIEIYGHPLDITTS